MIKVAQMMGVNSKEDTFRGIGVQTSELNKAITKSFSSRVKFVDSLDEADVVHVTKFHPFFVSLPWKKPAKKVVLTIHDLIQLIYPKNFKPGIKGKINFLINKYLIKKNVDSVITISETSKKDICRFLRVDPKKICVVYLAPKKVYRKLSSSVLNTISKKYNLPKKFALYVGDVNYNKNIPILVDGCKQADIPLVMVGRQAKDIEKLNLNHPELAHLKNVSFRDVTRLGYISDEDVAGLMNLANVYIQPSLYEGFGLPVLEALSCQTPVIAARTQALVEIAEEECTFFDPYSASDLAQKIEDIKNRKIVDLGKKYSWEKTAFETVKIYEEV